MAAALGTRLRLLRKRLGVTLDEFSQKTGISRNAISRAERDAIRQVNPRVLQQLLRQLSGRLKEAFPNGDPYDFLIPPLTFGGWLRNQRLRSGMAQKQLAKDLRVHVFTVVRYKSDRSKPDSSIRQRLRELFGADFEPLLERGTISSSGAGRGLPSKAARSDDSSRHETKKQTLATVQDRQGRRLSS